MKFSHERTVLVNALLAGAPGALLSTLLLFLGDYTTRTRLTALVLVAVFWIGFALAARNRVVRPLQTVANLLSALREGDYSIRGRGQGPDALGEVMLELNALAEIFRMQRLGALEATALLRTVMTEIDVAVFTFDERQTLRLTNRAGERLLAQPAERLLGRSAEELGLARALRDEKDTLEASFPGGLGRWGVKRGRFRQGGRVHQLLVLADLSRALREEEREAWQRLIRVLGHELNNSLAPIKSIAGSLESLVNRSPRAPDWEEDMKRGLEVIAARAEALSRFMEAYARLARLPKPRHVALDAGEAVRRAAGLETRLAVTVAPGPSAPVSADPDQLEQLLINLVRNAADAALETKGAVRAGWTVTPREVEIFVEDDGPGLPETANLFVPFFTTKPEGSGIGLVLSRQIAEAHGGTLTLANRKGGHGCRATLRLARERNSRSPSEQVQVI